MFIRLFGDVAVEDPGGERNPGPPAQRKLLSLLALRAGYRCSLGYLIDEMWGENPPDNAERMVRMYVSRLRKVLGAGDGGSAGAEVLVTDDGGYRLTLDESLVDALRFERLVEEGEASGDPRLIGEALALWRGEPLAEFPYDEFAVRARERLDRRRLDALELRLSAELRFGASGAAIAGLRDLVEEHPWREKLWELLILGLYRSGRQTESLRTYDRLRERLAGAGLEPGPGLRRLATAVAGHDEEALVIEPAGNLPAPVDGFIGRDEEMRRLGGLLDSDRLVTLVGAGGSGKTRLALETAGASSRPAWLIDLSDVLADSGVAETLVAALGQPQASRADPVAIAARVVGARPVLLVFDNCEHVIEGAGVVVEHLLSQCPNLTVIATSREPLRVRGESVFTVAPLGLPDDDGLESIVGSEAGRLFVDRARAVAPGFEITRDNAAAAALILRRLDGIPLAVELAAAVVRETPIVDLARSLSESVAEVGVARRTALARHRTMTTALEWSYRLLDRAEQGAFRCLGVMLGCFDPAAAAAVGADRNALRSLVAKSLVERAGGGQYRLLVPVREYALRLADETGERPDLEQRRNEHFVGVVEELGEGFRRWDEPEFQRRFDDARVHLLAAVEALHLSDPERAARLVYPLTYYWANLGKYAEGLRLSRRARDHAPTAEDRILLDVAMAHMMQRGGDLPGGSELASRAVADARAIGAGSLLAVALNALGSNQVERGLLGEAGPTLREAVDAYREHRAAESFIPLINLSAQAAWSGDVEAAAEINHELRSALDAGEISASNTPYLEVLEAMHSRFSGDLQTADERLAAAVAGFAGAGSQFHRLVAMVEHARVRLELGDVSGAESMFGDAIAEADEGSSFNWMRGTAVLAQAALARGDPNRARSLLRDVVREAVSMEAPGRLSEVVDTAAMLAAEAGDRELAARFVAHADRLVADLSTSRDPFEESRMRDLRETLPEVDLAGDAPVDQLLAAFFE